MKGPKTKKKLWVKSPVVPFSSSLQQDGCECWETGEGGQRNQGQGSQDGEQKGPERRKKLFSRRSRPCQLFDFSVSLICIFFFNDVMRVEIWHCLNGLSVS